MSQTSYSVNQAASFAGMLGDAASPIDSRVYLAKTGVPIPFGLVVAKDVSGDSICRLPTGSTDDLVGVSLASQSVEQSIGGSTPQYAALEAVPVLRKGRVWVTCEQAVTPADSVFVRYAAGAGGSQLGSVRKDVDTASAVAFAKAKFLTTCTAGALVLLDINI